MMPNIELKPCPFCGADESFLTTIVVGTEICFVKCSVCGGASGRAASRKEAEEAWNMRGSE